MKICGDSYDLQKLVQEISRKRFYEDKIKNFGREIVALLDENSNKKKIYCIIQDISCKTLL